MEIRARKVIKAMKIYGLCCADCRTTDIMVLQFHHVKGGGSEENIRKVAEKINKAGKVLPDYVLVCANCHIHRDYKDKTRKHNVFLRDYYLLNRPPSSLS